VGAFGVFDGFGCASWRALKTPLDGNALDTLGFAVR